MPARPDRGGRDESPFSWLAGPAVGPHRAAILRARRGLAAVIAVAVVVIIVACGSLIASRPNAPRSAQLTATSRSKPVGVIDDATAAARADATSRALFAASPGVALAPADDPAAMRRAAACAARLHIPVLPTGRTSTAAARAEVDRLGARWFVGFGAVSAPSGLERAKASRAAIPVSHAPIGTIVVVGAPSADAAALGTVRAAGARIVVMPRGITDISAASSVITALHAVPTDHVLLLGSTFTSTADPAWTVQAAQTGWQLPGGGQRPFTGHRYVALYGIPGVPALGALGRQNTDQTIARVKELASRYDDLSAVPVVPTLELIATLAAGAPGTDRDYSTELDLSTLQPDIDAATKAHMAVIIDLQPGRSDFLAQAKQYAKLLEQPNVGLALDPEWRLGAHQLPLKQIGSVSASEVNATSAWLADLVTSHHLPPKMFVLHEFRTDMISDRSALVRRAQLDTLIHVDGQGTQPDKQATWNALHAGSPSWISWGWKNFIYKDHPMLTPAQTMRDVHESPTLITYQ